MKLKDLEKEMHLTSIPYSKEIGNYFKLKRKQAGLKQMDLAHKLGFRSPQFVSNVERGICAYSTQHLVIVVKACYIDTDELIRLFMEEYRSFVKSKLEYK